MARVTTKSVARRGLSAENGANYFLQVDVSSPRDIIAFLISFTTPEKEIAERVRTRGLGAWRRTLSYFLLP
jgi:hypothetical protein